jgi:ketosteroid isomerase-like protein
MALALLCPWPAWAAEGGLHPPGAGLDEPAVHALLGAWREAQEAADFAGYAGLHAPDFTARVGDGAGGRRWDANGWLSRERPRFGRRMTVEVADLQVATAGQVAVARFRRTVRAGREVQVAWVRWLVGLREGGPCLLRQDEVEAPAQERRKAQVPHPPAEPARPVLAADGLYLVLDQDPEERWGVGEPAWLGQGAQVLVSRPVDHGLLPLRLVAEHGRPVRVHGAAGQVCSATQVELALVTRLDLPRALLAGGEEGGHQETWPGPGAEQAAWELGGVSALPGDPPVRVLVARLVPAAQTRCEGGLWAWVDDGGAAPAPLPLHTLREEEAEQARRALRGLPGWKALQRRYKAEVLPRNWKSGARHKLPEPAWDRESGVVLRSAFIGGGERAGFLLVDVRAEAGAAFGAAFWALWRVPGEGLGDPGEWVLFSDAESPGPGTLPAAALALPGRDALLLVGPQGVVRAVGPVHRRTQAWGAAWL